MLPSFCVLQGQRLRAPPLVQPATTLRVRPQRGFALTAASQSRANRAASAAQTLLTKVAAAAAAALLLAAPPALAEVSTLSAEEVVSSAKPLPTQQVNKGRVWLVFALGASALYGTAVLVENNASWFPAIARANRALKAGAAAADEQGLDEKEEELAVVDAQFTERLEAVKEERAADARLESAVLAGLQSAKAKALPAEPKAAAESEASAERDAMDAAALADVGDSSAAGHGEPADEAAGEASAARPIFEISGEQIAASAQKMQRRDLQGASLEQLERELQERRAAAGNSSSGGVE